MGKKKWGSVAQPRLGTGRIASCLSMTDLFDRLETALADRCAVEREIGAGGIYLAREPEKQPPGCDQSLAILIRERP